VHGNNNNPNYAMHGGNYSPMGQSMHEAPSASFENTYGEASGGPRQNIGVTAWGARSDNVWGTFTDNAWGTSADTVWGTNTSDIWGGVGGNPYGAGGRSVQIWGTGSGKNYIKAITNLIRKLFGRPHKQTVNAFKNARASSNAARGPRTAGSAPRGAAPVRSSAPTTTRTR
jgi:hypothetical protein